MIKQGKYILSIYREVSIGRVQESFWTEETMFAFSELKFEYRSRENHLLQSFTTKSFNDGS